MSQLTTKLVRYCNLGSIDFGSALKLQRAAVEKVRETNSAGMLLLLEHTPVYTIGIRTKDYSKEDELRLINTGAEYFKTNRGGLITFHGPGQLVVYPILNLKHFKTSMKWYICSLEKMVIDTCAKYSLNAETSPHTGVWIGDRKVCAIGVHGSRYITSHGIALNCNTDLEWFEKIVPCGIPDKGVTSLSKELGRDVGVEEVRPKLLESFEKLFECRTECLKSVENL